MIELVRSQLTHPLVDVNRLLEWQVFNVVVGNSDGHGKNLSVLYEGGHAVVAPFYDIVATRQYESLDRKLALSVGGRRDPDQLHRAQWEQFAVDVGVGSRLVVATVQRLVERVRHELTAWIAEFRSTYGRLSILQTLPVSIDKRARAILRRLG